jgi:hypothetical protein
VNILLEIVGYTGSACLLAAYFLAARGIWPSDTKPSIILNMFGGLFLVIYQWLHNAKATVALNAIWLVIGILALRKAISVSSTKSK